MRVRTVDYYKVITTVLLLCSFYSGGICSNWYGLAGPRVKKTPIVTFCALVDDLKDSNDLSEGLIELCANFNSDTSDHHHH